MVVMSVVVVAHGCGCDNVFREYGGDSGVVVGESTRV